jgi:hypothetical protein
MNKRIDEIFDQVMDEDCANPLYRFAELVRQDERELCAKLCDDWLVGRDDICEVAKAIRARGQK